PSRSDQKRASILDSARQLFFQNGFLGTSMDQVAALAAVSKQTVYKHFDDKESLFREVVADVVRVRDGGIPETLLTEGEGSIGAQLRMFARYFLRGLTQPEVLKLRRLVIGEAGRFPELGRAFYELGPKRAAEQLAAVIRNAAQACDISIESPKVAAEHFWWLILSGPLDRAMLLGEESFAESALDKTADDGVLAFLRAYGFAED
ncbi:MAG: TetR/AcrR family transcriptional regulator, partial [Candidatus Acidiferrales bacterium]